MVIIGESWLRFIYPAGPIAESAQQIIARSAESGPVFQQFKFFFFQVGLWTDQPGKKELDFLEEADF